MFLSAEEQNRFRDQRAKGQLDDEFKSLFKKADDKQRQVI
jgi:hypothetical protein